MDDATATVPGWRRDGERLRRRFEFADFDEAWAFMTRVAELAREHGHHPDWSNSWNVVEISLTSHDAGRLTGRDVRLATAINELTGPTN